eukprot:TRINITY_DN6288_c0_g1_i1.p1 TRINITY_DN6288_c0_g1~~TRINITY_DN6288_c0_g1_i1.p1  ORF type:complete len:152 (+),score=30.01 TRINITY_DN6288_c0_g1_i1:35-457(+)
MIPKESNTSSAPSNTSPEESKLPNSTKEDINPNRAISVKMLQGPIGVEMKTRTYASKTYNNCFIGHELVDWLLKNCFAIDRKMAKERAVQLQGRGVFSHVDGKSEFTDDDSLYNFLCCSCGQKIVTSISSDCGSLDKKKC